MVPDCSAPQPSGTAGRCCWDQALYVHVVRTCRPKILALTRRTYARYPATGHYSDCWSAAPRAVPAGTEKREFEARAAARVGENRRCWPAQRDDAARLPRERVEIDLRRRRNDCRTMAAAGHRDGWRRGRRDQTFHVHVVGTDCRPVSRAEANDVGARLRQLEVTLTVRPEDSQRCARRRNQRHLQARAAAWARREPAGAGHGERNDLACLASE